jgi:Fur family ferric uptake transcriptional regulator
MESGQDFKKIFHNTGLKSTPPRIAVLKTLLEMNRPTTTQEIYQKLRKSGIDLVTLYRTMASFEKSSLIRQVNLRKEAVYYELNKNHHHHIVCTACGTVEDFENPEIEKVLGKVIKKSSKFKDIKEHSLEIFGFCKNCAQN